MNLKKIIKQFYWLIIKRNFYGLTSSLRVLPNFIIIGAMKSGTTSLSYNISEHPCVTPPKLDEIVFFDVNFDLGFNWYRSFFTSKYHKNKIISNYGVFSTGDDTPFYFWREDAAERIKKYLPKTKFIVLLRNPIDRAYSNYMDEVIRNEHSNNFEKDIDLEIKLILKEKDYNLSKNNFERYSRNPSHIAKGFYAEQLSMWFRHFEKDNFLIISSEKLITNPKLTMSKVYNFLELPSYTIQFPQIKKQKNYPLMNSDTSEFLKNFYQPYNEKLFDLINTRFDWN